MKATLTFSIPEETEEHRTALEGHVYRSILEDLCRSLREIAKYDGDGEFYGVALADLFKASDGAAKLREAIYRAAADEEVPLT